MFDDLMRAIGRVATEAAAASCLLRVRAYRTEYAVLACSLREALARVTVTEEALRAVWEEGRSAGRASAAAEVTWLREQLAAAEARAAAVAGPVLARASGEAIALPAPRRHGMRAVRPLLAPPRNGCQDAPR